MPFVGGFLQVKYATGKGHNINFECYPAKIHQIRQESDPSCLWTLTVSSLAFLARILPVKFVAGLRQTKLGLWAVTKPGYNTLIMAGENPLPRWT